jgi:hypothetical protein
MVRGLKYVKKRYAFEGKFALHHHSHLSHLIIPCNMSRQKLNYGVRVL